ncbi:VOC family protein [Paraburkholderia phytofirmans]|uniref:VOC family protein n=1 Tax=Paraburkholderia phytofirmans TaxID=261302 RepID=UPI0038BABD3E
MTSELQLDHFVIAVADLTGAVADYSALGFKVLPGGKHQHAPTQNALVVFEDGTYFELIEWTRADPGDRWYRELSEHGEGLVDFALVPRDIKEVLAQAEAHQLGYKGPIDGSRVTPKGDLLEWQLGRPESAELPFFCADITPRSLRVAGGEIRIQPNRVQGIVSVAVAVADAATALARYRQLLASQAESVAFADARSVGRLGVDASIITINGAEIILVSSQRSATTPAAEWINSLLTRRGPGAYALALRIPDGTAPRLYGPEKARGVYIELSVDDVPLARRVFPAGA